MWKESEGKILLYLNGLLLYFGLISGYVFSYVECWMVIKLFICKIWFWNLLNEFVFLDKRFIKMKFYCFDVKLEFKMWDVMLIIFF